MAFKKNLKEINKIDCPCGWSRRPFTEHKSAYAQGSFHGTIFTQEKRALPHFHVPTDNNPNPTHETYAVTDENTKPGAYIYIGKGAIEAKPGVVVNVHPGVVHGGTGNFTPLILGVPGFSDEGEVELTDEEQINKFYNSGMKNIITPRRYQIGCLVKLTAEDPAVSFEHIYGEKNINILIAQTKKGEVYCGAFHPDLLIPNGFKDSEGPTYIMIRSGEGKINIGNNEIPVKPLDVLILQQEPFSIEEKEGLATTIMSVYPRSVGDLAYLN